MALRKSRSEKTLIVLVILNVFLTTNVLSQKDKETSHLDDPCAVVRCRHNTRCVAVLDPEVCAQRPNPHQPCKKSARCIPTGPNYTGPGNYGPIQMNCGPGSCPPGQSCEYVQVQCIQAPCPAMMTCVDYATIA